MPGGIQKNDVCHQKFKYLFLFCISKNSRYNSKKYYDAMLKNGFIFFGASNKKYSQKAETLSEKTKASETS